MCIITSLLLFLSLKCVLSQTTTYDCSSDDDCSDITCPTDSECIVNCEDCSGLRINAYFADSLLIKATKLNAIWATYIYCPSVTLTELQTYILYTFRVLETNLKQETKNCICLL